MGNRSSKYFPQIPGSADHFVWDAFKKATNVIYFEMVLAVLCLGAIYFLWKIKGRYFEEVVLKKK